MRTASIAAGAAVVSSLITALGSGGLLLLGQWLSWRQERKAREEERADERQRRRVEFQIRTLKALRSAVARHARAVAEVELRYGCMAVVDRIRTFDNIERPVRLFARSRDRIHYLLPGVEDPRTRSLVVELCSVAGDICGKAGRYFEADGPTPDDQAEADRLSAELTDRLRKTLGHIGELLRAYHAGEAPPSPPESRPGNPVPPGAR